MAYIGDNTLGAIDYSAPTDYVFIRRFQASSSFDAAYIYIGIRGQYTGHNKLCIYSDNSGVPNALLGYTSEITGKDIGGNIRQWVGAALVSAVSITNGSYYWIGFMGDNITYAAASETTGGDIKYNENTYGTFDDPFVVDGSNTYTVSIYATDTKRTLEEGMKGSVSLGGGPVETSSGDKYIVVTEMLALCVVKITDGDVNPYSIVFSATYIAIHGSGAMVESFDIAIDSNNDIHFVSATNIETDRDVSYAVCDLTTGFGTWEQAADFSEQAPIGVSACSIAVDSSNKAHIFFVDNVKQTGSSQDNIYYTNNVSGWLTPEQVGNRPINTDCYHWSRISLDSAGDVHAVYSGGACASGLTWACYRKRTSGTWSTEDKGSSSSQAADGLDLTVYGITPNVMVVDAEGDILEGTDVDILADTGYNQLDNPGNIAYSSASMIGATRYIFFRTTTPLIQLISNSGSGWVNEGTIQTVGTLIVTAEWAYNHENQDGEIHYAHGDTGSTYFATFSPSSLTQVYKDIQAKWDTRELIYDDLQVKFDIEGLAATATKMDYYRRRRTTT